MRLPAPAFGQLLAELEVREGERERVGRAALVVQEAHPVPSGMEAGIRRHCSEPSRPWPAAGPLLVEEISHFATTVGPRRGQAVQIEPFDRLACRLGIA